MLTAFGFYLTIYLMIRFKGEVAERFADQAMIFWLTSAVGGGIGYLIGSSMNRNSKTTPPGSTTDTEIVTTETKKETTVTDKKE
jgi:predicted membrane protein